MRSTMFTTPKILFTVIASIILSSCALPETYNNQSSPGFTNIKGWNNQPAYFNGADGVPGTASDIDIDGQIGYPLTVWNPTANCIGANGQSAAWTLSPSVTSGALPPGLVMGDSPYQITGIPTARGHWIVTLTSGDMACDGKSYMNFTQNLRFHIKGSGEVVE